MFSLNCLQTRYNFSSYVIFGWKCICLFNKNSLNSNDFVTGTFRTYVIHSIKMRRFCARIQVEIWPKNSISTMCTEESLFDRMGHICRWLIELLIKWNDSGIRKFIWIHIFFPHAKHVLSEKATKKRWMLCCSSLSIYSLWKTSSLLGTYRGSDTFKLMPNNGHVQPNTCQFTI